MQHGRQHGEVDIDAVRSAAVQDGLVAAANPPRPPRTAAVGIRKLQRRAEDDVLDGHRGDGKVVGLEHARRNDEVVRPGWPGCSTRAPDAALRRPR